MKFDAYSLDHFNFIFVVCKVVGCKSFSSPFRPSSTLQFQPWLSRPWIWHRALTSFLSGRFGYMDFRKAQDDRAWTMRSAVFSCSSQLYNFCVIGVHTFINSFLLMPHCFGYTGQAKTLRSLAGQWLRHQDEQGKILPAGHTRL